MPLLRVHQMRVTPRFSKKEALTRSDYLFI